MKAIGAEDQSGLAREIIDNRVEVPSTLLSMARLTQHSAVTLKITLLCRELGYQFGIFSLSLLSLMNFSQVHI